MGTQVSVLKDFTLAPLGSVSPLVYESEDMLGMSAELGRDTGLVYESEDTLGMLAELGRDTGRLKQRCRKGDRSCRPPAPRGT